MTFNVHRYDYLLKKAVEKLFLIKIKLMETIILILSQIIFSFSRTLNVRCTAKENVLYTLITGVVIKLTWLISSYIGINALINKDYTIAIIYILSGVLGDYLSFKIKIK